jgi:hypothetical protein
MAKVQYMVLVPMEGEQQWFVLCKCETSAAAAAVVQALLDTGFHPPLTVKVEKVIIHEV